MRTSAAKTLPEHIHGIDAEGIAHIKLIDAAPIGINVRSTVATYAGIHDELRRIYAPSADAKERGYKASDFSYNTAPCAPRMRRNGRCQSGRSIPAGRKYPVPGLPRLTVCRPRPTM